MLKNLTKEEINSYLIKIFKQNKETTIQYFKDPKTIKAIEDRKKIKKFGLAAKRDNNYVTNISNEDIFITREDNEEEVYQKHKESKLKNNKIICRYCNGDHMSYKCNDRYYENEELSKSIKICNLPSDITENELYELFDDFGDVDRITIPRNVKYRDDICKYAYVNFNNHYTAQQAVNELNNTPFDNLILNVYLQ
jgi:RNA recognition motif-containing protein